MEKTVYIIVINYCNYTLTLKCIESIKKSTYKNIKIVVVDNDSPDHSGEKIALIQGINYIQSDKNLGFSYGNNIGIRYSLQRGADYIMLLNNDTEIDEHMIELLVNGSADKYVAVPKMYYFDFDGRQDIIWYAGGELDRTRVNGIHIGAQKADSNQYSTRKFVSFATGCCMLIPVKIIMSIGYLDENYFMYCEDTDYSFRLNNKGFKIIYIPEATLRHKVSSTAGGEMSRFICYYIIRNKFYCAKKNNVGTKSKLFIYAETLYRFIKACFGRYYKNYKIAPKAVCDYAFGRMGKQL